MRPIVLLCCAAWLIGGGLSAAPLSRKKTPTPEPAEVSAEDILGKDLAAAVDAAGQAYGAIDAAMTQQSKRKRGGANAALRELSSVRADYAKALQQARDAKVGKDDGLLRDQVVVSLTQSLRACDLITQGLRDDDEDEQRTGAKLAALAQGDLDDLAAGNDPAGGAGEPNGGSPALGPSLGMNIGMTSQSSNFNVNMDLNVSMPVSRAMDVGVGGTTSISTQGDFTDGSGNVGLGGNIFTRYHFLDAFPSRPNWVPYVGAKLGLNWGTQWQGRGINFTSTDSLGTEFAGDLGLLLFMDAKSAITVQTELGSTSTNNDNGTTTSNSSSSSLALTVGFRRMF